MDNEMIGLIVSGVVLLIVVGILIRGLFWFKGLITRPMTKRRQVQAYINAKAYEQPVGPGTGLKKMRGWKRLLWLIVAIILAYLLISGDILDNFLKF
jgi:hypothetical protein